ncbi:hypothetical protein ACWD4G_27495 [Streptomyces sp. NPDC002643]
MFATTGSGGMWAFTGYTGAAFTTATRIAVSALADRDLVSLGDHNADGEPDLLYGTPDVTGDGIPDIWTLTSGGSVKVYAGGAKALGSGVEVISASSGWAAKLAFG